MRTPGLLALPSLLAPALLWPVLSAGPVGAANDQDARIVDATVVYDCDSAVGGGPTEVAVRVSLPRTVTAGTKMAARPWDVTVVVPEELTAELRERGVEEVSARSDDATYEVGPRTRRLRDVVLPPTVVPGEGLLILEGQGQAQAVRLKKVDTYPVRVPEAFSARLSFVGETEGETDLSCTLAEGARAKIATVRVVP